MNVSEEKKKKKIATKESLTNLSTLLGIRYFFPFLNLSEKFFSFDAAEAEKSREAAVKNLKKKH